MTSDKVLLLQDTQACIVEADTAMEDICAPGPRRFMTDGLLPEPGSFWRVVTQPGPNPTEVFITTRSGGRGYAMSVQLSEAGFGAGQVLTSTGAAFSELALSPDGRLLLTVERNAEVIGGTLSGIEVVPGQPDRIHLIRRNQNPAYPAEVSRSQLAATADPSTPFVTATQNAIQRFQESSQDWVSFDFGRDTGLFLTPRDMFARRGEDGSFRVYTTHTKGRVFRFGDQDNFDARAVPMRFPKEYRAACDPTAGTVANQTVQDFRAVLVRRVHDAFTVVQPCSLLIWFDPEPESVIDEHVSLIRGGELGTQWPSIGDPRTRHKIRLMGDEVWVGGGPTLMRARRPIQ